MGLDLALNVVDEPDRPPGFAVRHRIVVKVDDFSNLRVRRNGENQHIFLSGMGRLGDGVTGLLLGPGFDTFALGDDADAARRGRIQVAFDIADDVDSVLVLASSAEGLGVNEFATEEGQGLGGKEPGNTKLLELRP